MDRIKIAHVVECAGGVDKYLRLLFSHLDKRQFDNVLVCSHDFVKEHYEGLVSDVIYTDMHNSLSLMSSMRAIRQVHGVIKRINPDIIYCHSSIGGGIGRIASLRMNIPVIYNPHGWAFNMPYGLKPKLFAFMERILARKTDRIVVISEFEKENALRKGITNKDKIQVIVSGIDLDKTVLLSKDSGVTRATLGIPENSFVVGMTARLCETKAPDIFVKAAVIIKKKIPNAFFIMIGDGELRDSIETLINKLKLQGSVLITGWVDNPLPYVRLLNVGTLLSRWEGFGLALAEYMKLEVPVVATNVCAIPNTIKDGYNGLLVEVNKENDVANAIIKIYDNPILRKQFMDNGLKFVNKYYDIQRTAKEHEFLFQNLLQ